MGSVESTKPIVENAIYIPLERILLVPNNYASIYLHTVLLKTPTTDSVEKKLTIRTPVLDYIDSMGVALSRETNSLLIDRRIGGFTVEKDEIFYINKRGENILFNQQVVECQN